MNLIPYPYRIPGNDGSPDINTVGVDPETGTLYLGDSPLVQYENGTIGVAPRVSDYEGPRYQIFSVDPKTDYILSDPISVKMLQSGYVPTDMGNVYFNPTTQKYAISRNQEGIDKIWGGFYQSYDPKTGAVIIGDASRGWDIVNHAINYRNSIYQGGDWMSDFLGAVGPAALMGGVGALALAPVAAAALPETVAPAVAAPLAEAAAPAAALSEAAAAPVGALADANLAGSAAAAEFGGGNAIADLGINQSLAQSLVDAGVPAQLVQNLPSIQDLATRTAINAGTQLLTTGKVDPSKVITSVGAGAAGSAVGSTVAQDVLSATDNSLLASIAGGAAKGALTGAITGADPLQTALASGAASGLSSVAQDAGIPIPQNVTNAVVSGIANGQPLNQVLTGAAIAAGTGAAKDLISSAYNTYNAYQQAAGLQAASDLGNAPTQGFDENGNPIYRDSSGVWTNEQGVPVDPSTGEPVQTSISEYNAPTVVAGTQDVGGLPYKTDYTGSSVSDTGEIPPVIGDYPVTQQPTVVDVQTNTNNTLTYTFDDGSTITSDSRGNVVSSTPTPTITPISTPNVVDSGVTGALPSSQQVMPEILVEDQQPATTPLPPIPAGEWVSGYDLPYGDTSTPISTPTTTPTTTPVTTTVPVAAAVPSAATSGLSGASGSAGSGSKASDISTYVNPIPAYLRPTELSTGAVSQATPLWSGIDPRLASILTQRVAHGGQIHPQLMRVLQERGGELVPGPENRMYMRHAKRGFAVTGPGTGQSDDIPTMLADGEYVFDADTVAALGDGSSKAGAEALDKMREAIRAHKRSAPVDKIPPKAKSPLEYLKMAKRK